MEILISPQLAEQVVEAELRARQARGERHLTLRYRTRADALYESLSPGKRQEAFEKLHAQFFEELGFSALLQRGVEGFPELSERSEGLFVFPAHHEHEEGVELGREAPRLGLRLQAERFADPDGLARFLPRPFTRASLLLSETFGYRPEEDPGRNGPRVPSAVVGRYQALWELIVEARLRAGAPRSEPGGWGRAFESFSAWFGVPGERGRALFERLREAAGGLTHPDMVRFAHAPAALWEWVGERPALAAYGLGARGRERVPGERCPLCEFPTHAWCYPSGGAQAEVVAAIREDFPPWAPEDGLCSRCLEGYRLRVAWGAAPQTAETEP